MTDSQTIEFIYGATAGFIGVLSGFLLFHANRFYKRTLPMILQFLSTLIILFLCAILIFKK